MDTSIDSLMTVGQIITATGLPYHNVHYILTTRRIAPVRRVGGIRLFGPDVVARVKQAVEEIHGRRRAVAQS